MKITARYMAQPNGKVVGTHDLSGCFDIVFGDLGGIHLKVSVRSDGPLGQEAVTITASSVISIRPRAANQIEVENEEVL